MTKAQLTEKDTVRIASAHMTRSGQQFQDPQVTQSTTGFTLFPDDLFDQDTGDQ